MIVQMPKLSVTLKAECCLDRPHIAKGLCTGCYQHYNLVRKGAIPVSDRYHRLATIVAGHAARKSAVIATRAALKNDRRNERGRATGKFRNSSLLKRYGITSAQFDQMLSAQGGGCALCGNTCPNGGFYVDHSHATGAVRSILCPRCNTFVGLIETAPSLVPLITSYIKEHK